MGIKKDTPSVYYELVSTKDYNAYVDRHDFHIQAGITPEEQQRMELTTVEPKPNVIDLTETVSPEKPPNKAGEMSTNSLPREDISSTPKLAF